MSDRGVTLALRDPDGRQARRAQNIHDDARARWKAARTDLDQLAAAFDYARSALAAAARGGLKTGSERDQATRLLWAIGDALTARMGATGDRDG